MAFGNRDRDGLERALKTGRVQVGSGFELGCRFFFTGPGRLEIGDNVSLLPSPWNVNHYVTFSTYHPDAVIRIGDGTVLEGTRMGCRLSLVVGPDCYIGDASIMDTDFHSLDAHDRDAPDKVKASPVEIGRGVRVGYGCHILRGVTIGEETVVRPLSIVSQPLPGGIVAFGFPARREGSSCE